MTFVTQYIIPQIFTPLYVTARYHHTGPVSGFFALRESLAILAEKVEKQMPSTYFITYSKIVT